MSRSTRQRKPVNYRKLLDDESDNSEDDFASGPPPKKPRAGGPEGDAASMKSKGKDTQIMKSTAVKEVPKKQTRLSRDEKQFSRQLEQALVASKNETGTNVGVSSEPIPGDGDTTASSISTSESNTVCSNEKGRDGDFVPDETVLSDESEGESFSAVEEDEDSDFSASPQLTKGKKTKSTKENIKSAPKGKQAKAKKPTATKPINVSVDKLGTNSLAKKAVRPSTVKVTPAKPVVQKSTPSVTRIPNLKVNSSNCGKQLKSSLGSVKCEGGSPGGVLGVNKRVMNWTPPAKVGEGRQKTDSLSSKSANVRSGSGGTPVIRVGLSRNARVKSLHTNVKT